MNCSASVARFIADEFNRSGILDDYPHIDGVVPFVQGSGCGMAGKGSEGFEVMQRTEWGYATHPNIAGALMVGLGCEVMQIPGLVEDYGLKENEMFRTMTIQATGGTRKTVERGVAMIKEMLPLANAFRRESVPVSEIMLALQCGGSDGYSGITANPALGRAADLLVEQGGTAVLCETPEIYGAEHLLTRRAATREIGEKLRRHHQMVGGLHGAEPRRDEQQSLARQQGGRAHHHPREIARRGGQGRHHDACAASSTTPSRSRRAASSFMDSPGYDPVGVTGQVASRLQHHRLHHRPRLGLRLQAVAVDQARHQQRHLYAARNEDMDINCGDILDGVTIEAKGKEIFEKVIAVASGEKSKSEELGYGDNEFVPWQIGAVM